MLKDDDQMLLKVRKPENVDEVMVKLLQEYFKKKKCAYYAKLILITVCDKETQLPLEAEHYCVIIKPQNKYSIDKDNYNIFKLMEPFLNGDDDFVDFSILGHFNTMQIYDEENSVQIYSSF